jgi:16S rRNA (guanine1207-N2)-methyltransferase
MSDHYYTKSPQIRHDRQVINVTLRGRKFTFATDAGVFSKKGIDFGSQLLIEHMDIPVAAEVLDVGCGYGPIGLAAAHLVKEGVVTMVDINERAVELAVYNAGQNEIHNVNIMQSNLFEQLGNAKFSRILTNPPIRAGKQVVHQIFEGAAERLLPGGQLWIVIQKKQGAPSAMAKLESLFASVEEVKKDKGYRIIKAVFV